MILTARESFPPSGSLPVRGMGTGRPTEATDPMAKPVPGFLQDKETKSLSKTPQAR